MLPSWIKSRNCKPRLVYFFAMETTRRRLASVSSFFACSASASPRRISVRVRLNSVKPTLPETPISFSSARREGRAEGDRSLGRSEEHTSELQSHLNLVCRLLLEKKKKACDHVARYATRDS